MINPFKSKYKSIKNISLVNKRLLIFMTIVTILSIVIQQVYKDPNIIRFLDIVICVCAVTYNALILCISYLYIRVEDKKRADLIDDAMKTNFSSERTEDYYSNKQLGISRLAANNFESCLYSYQEITYDYNHYWPIAIIIFFIYLCASLIGAQNILIVILKLSIPFVVVTKCIKMLISKFRFESILSDYRKLFYSKPLENDRFNAWAINLFVKYETTLSWGQILLSDKAYETQKSEIEKEWKVIKETYDL